MPEPHDDHKPIDSMDEGFGNVNISPPAAASPRSRGSEQQAGPEVIPQFFLDAILEVIAKSIEQALADVMARCVNEGVHRAIRPLAMEIAFMRSAIEHRSSSGTQRRPNLPPDPTKG